MLIDLFCVFFRFYNFTTLACQLNEWEDDTAPTDTRRRPDQRLMETGQWDESNLQKLRWVDNLECNWKAFL